jgi:hypothetical protein
MEPTPAVALTNPSLRDTYLTEKQLAKELPKCTVRKLRTWRSLRVGPPWLKVGRETVYLRSSVDGWMEREAALTLDREHRRARRR